MWKKITSYRQDSTCMSGLRLMCFLSVANVCRLLIVNYHLNFSGLDPCSSVSFQNIFFSFKVFLHQYIF